jgi:peptidoglycan-associated lipoprotein
MNLLSKSLSFALLSAVVALTGCVKKPQRPDPSSTVMGQNGSGALGMGDAGAFNNGLADQSAAGIEARPDGVYEDEDKITGLLGPVYFDFNLFGIKESERPKLQAAKEYLDKNPQHHLLLEGHCDWRGTAEYNLGLGDRRAAAAKKYLTTLGVPASKIEIVSKGDIDAPENASDADMAKDRRAEIIILKK